MASTFSLKSLIEGHRLIYIAPILAISSLFHIFDSIPAKHQFGQLEILGAFIVTGYYLWVQISNIYAPQLIGRKRIELVVCAVVGIFSALLLFAPLMTWQYITLYYASDRSKYTKPISIALLTLWMGTFIFFYGTYSFNLNKLQQLQPPQMTTTGISQ